LYGSGVLLNTAKRKRKKSGKNKFSLVRVSVSKSEFACANKYILVQKCPLKYELMNEMISYLLTWKEISKQVFFYQTIPNYELDTQPNKLQLQLWNGEKNL